MRHVTDKTPLTQKRLLIFVTLFTFLTATGFPLRAADPLTPSAPASDSLYVGIGTSKNPNAPLIEVTTAQVEFHDPSQIQKAIHQEAAHKDHTIIVSSDIDSVLAETSIQTDLPKNRFFLAPAADFIKSFSSNSIDSIKQDKIGALILTYTLGSEVYVWMHITTMTRLERGANIIYAVTLALMYSLNKDAWANAAEPIKNSFRKLLHAHEVSPTHYKEIASRFLGNFTLGTMVTLIRVPLISLSSILATGIHLNYFTRPMLATFIATAALFTWSDHIAMISETDNPKAKWVFRRTAEFRSFILATFATTASLLHPGHTAYTPWITIGVVGVLGATVYFNNERINRWIEYHRLAKYIPTPMSCKNLFN